VEGGGGGEERWARGGEGRGGEMWRVSMREYAVRDDETIYRSRSSEKQKAFCVRAPL
jgi:hypothetical protein